MLILGNCLAVLPTLAENSIHCVVTSPPYFGLRDYGHDDQIGLEPAPEQYVAKLVEVFRGVWRVLRDDGTLWLNLGDSYAGSSTGGFRPGAGRADGVVDDRNQRNRNGLGCPDGLKPKDLIGIPWRVAFALQADGWWLRSDIIWHKPNPMPESVTDRPTKAHEYVFLLTKSARYFYDAAAIAEPAIGGIPGNRNQSRADQYANGDQHFRTSAGLVAYAERQRNARKNDGQATGGNGSKIADHIGNSLNRPDGLRNRRTVWTIATAPYAGAHFATFPPALVEPPTKRRPPH